MESDFEFETKVRSSRHWARSARYEDADNDPVDQGKASRGQALSDKSRPALTLVGLKDTPWASSSQFRGASRAQDD
ncbi:hypothetical protein GCM10010970_01330 [Silvimonas iriomotensis]|uniref:Uncharacterized protein n=1 Tax=Silvimonas iriomotensis TaxID=449662 RepID=A0ABQ2P439_9NEIS|nr:hypothetical protein GCM10010970_01330 [Silvimonas iriomotensis]